MIYTTLDAVNELMGPVGPASSLASNDPDVVNAVRELETATRALQSRGWWFNEEVAVKMLPDTANELVLPQNTSTVRPQDPFTFLTQRGRRLYDPVNQTFKFNHPVIADIKLTLPFEELPLPAQMFCIAAAGRRFHAKYEGDQTIIQSFAADEQQAMLELKQQQTLHRRANIYNTPTSIRSRSAHKPNGYRHTAILPHR